MSVREAGRAGGFAVLAATLALLVVWLARGYGEPARVETYAEPAESFRARVEAEVKAYATGRVLEEKGTPVVRPPAGDVAVLARRWEFTPALELEPGKTYRLHIMAEDVVHSAAVGDTETLLEPGRVRVITVTAPTSGRVRIQCGEYCGLGHTKMIGSIEVVAR